LLQYIFLFQGGFTSLSYSIYRYYYATFLSKSQGRFPVSISQPSRSFPANFSQPAYNPAKILQNPPFSGTMWDDTGRIPICSKSFPYIGTGPYHALTLNGKNVRMIWETRGVNEIQHRIVEKLM